MTIKRLIVLVATVLTVLIVASVMLQKEDMKKYAEAFVTAYDDEISFYFPRHRNQFPFYSNDSYAISACVSKTHGAAVLFNPSDDWLYKSETTGERVEKTIFGGNWSTWASFTFPPADPSESINMPRLIFGGSVETSGHPLVEMQGNASGIFQNVTVNSVHYHCVILKGSNETIFRTTEAAKNDAEFLFKHDLGIALSQSEEIRMRYAEPELTTLVQNLVIDKLTNKTLGYSHLEMEEDIEFIEKLAEYKYGISELMLRRPLSLRRISQ